MGMRDLSLDAIKAKWTAFRKKGAFKPIGGEFVTGDDVWKTNIRYFQTYETPDGISCARITMYAGTSTIKGLETFGAFARHKKNGIVKKDGKATRLPNRKNVSEWILAYSK